MGIIQRKDIEDKYKWNTGDLYESVDLWKADVKKVDNLIEDLLKYEGTISKSAKNLLDYLNHNEEILTIFSKVGVFAFIKGDENTKDPKCQELSQILHPIQLKYGQYTSFFVPEFLSIKPEKLEKFYNNEKGLSFYRNSLNKIFREKEHILSKSEEELLSQVSLLSGSSSEIFGMIDDADMTYGKVKDECGNKVTLTKGLYSELMKSSDRKVRKKAFKKFYKSYKTRLNTIASTYLASLKKDTFYSRVRKFNSSLEKSLFQDDISIDVYNNLLSTVKNNINFMEKYLAIKKSMLQLDTLHFYDISVPLVSELDVTITYEEGYEILLEGLSILGDDYISVLKEARDNRWIDVYETDGKRGGAYNIGPYGCHPYILLNHSDDLNSLFTLAHEMGHAMHSYYSNNTNERLYAGYTIFVAEVASTVNEVLLMQYLLRTTKDKKMKKYLLNYFLEQFRTTVYRQTMFAEFEKLVHEKVENGEPLTSESFSNIYKNLTIEYHGDGIIIDDEITYEWSRIPHFYRSFYVYKYATGFSAAVSIAKQILEDGEPAVTRYKEFLKRGCTDFPIELLKKAGVDMSSSQPIQDALDMFRDLVEELQNLN